MAVCAVDIFVLISGYFLCKSKKRTWDKPLSLLIQLILFSVLYYLITTVASGQQINVGTLAQKFLPKNYFVILYVALYMVSPYINCAIEKLTTHQFKKLLIVLVALFCLWPIFVDILRFYFGVNDFGLSTVGAWGSQHGYTIVSFVLIYILGAYLRLHFNIESITRQKYIFYAVFCVLAIFVWSVVDIHMLNKPAPDCALAYNNPFVIVEAAVLFILFKKMTFRNKIVNNLAGAAFTCYLIHGYFIHHIKIEYFVQQSPILLILHLVGAPLLLYFVSWVVCKVFNWVFKPLFSRLKRPIITNIID